MLFEPESGKPSDCMLAKWPDGEVHQVSELLVYDWRLRATTPAKKVETKEAKRVAGEGGGIASKCLQVGEEEAGQPLSIRVRQDRQPLMALYRGGHQICQAPIAKFGGEQSAAKFMRDLLEVNSKTWYHVHRAE